MMRLTLGTGAGFYHLGHLVKDTIVISQAGILHDVVEFPHEADISELFALLPAAVPKFARFSFWDLHFADVDILLLFDDLKSRGLDDLEMVHEYIL
jgi:hypothetical protein